jgi:hypothetical protein
MSGYSSVTMRAVSTFLALLALAACEPQPATSPSSVSDATTHNLIGTWATTEAPRGRVTYRADGTWVSVFVIELDGAEKKVRGNGTWKIEDNAIHNTTLAHDDIPGTEEIALPYLSVEKIVSVGDREYRYVCPVQGCTNTMRRVD